MNAPQISPNPQTMLTPQDSQRVMHSIIQRVATGPELSKNISQTEAAQGMTGILEGHINPVQAAIFLIALRMKRETMDENKGVLDGVLAATRRVTAAVDEVVDIADPYDGYNRCLPMAPFLGPLLAELGLPAVSHSAQDIGPKFGVTVRHVLAAAGVPVDLDPAAAAARLSDPAVGWSYIDQAQFCPGLNALVPLRQLMIKRQVLTTIEVCARPIAGRKQTHFVTGFVHKPYPPVYATLARHAGFDSALIIRGVEGGVIPSLRQAGKYHIYQDRDELVEADIDPQALGITQSVRSVPLPDDLPKSDRSGDEVAIMVDVPATAAAAARVGMAALGGEPGPGYDSLALTAALVLVQTRRAQTLPQAMAEVRRVLDSGRALARVR